MSNANLSPLDHKPLRPPRAGQEAQQVNGGIMKLNVKKIHKAAVLPRYATDGAACFDLHAIEPQGHIIQGVPKLVRTGLAFDVPEGWAMLIFSRSGHGFKNDVRLANCVGVIDSDYRGEVMVKLTRDLSAANFISVNAGERIAQAMLVQVPRVELVDVAELSDTDRGTGGFGSTGA